MSLEHYRNIIDRYGPPTDAQIVSAAEVERYRDRLPDGLLEFWMTFGRGVWPSGKFQLCDPALFEHYLQETFRNDPEFSASNLAVYGMGSFGNPLISNNELDQIAIDTNFMLFSSQKFPPDGGVLQPLDFYIARTILVELGDTTEQWVDDEGADMFPGARDELGIVGPGEMYGFFPALVAGGDNIVKNLRKVSAPEYHAFLSQIEPLKYYEWGFNDARGPRVIRMIGSQA